MRTVYRIIGFSLGACAPAAFVYGFWLIHHGLGFIMGALIAACYIHYYSPEERLRRKATAQEVASAIRQFEDRVRASASENLRRRGVN